MCSDFPPFHPSICLNSVVSLWTYYAFKTFLSVPAFYWGESKDYRERTGQPMGWHHVPDNCACSCFHFLCSRLYCSVFSAIPFWFQSLFYSGLVVWSMRCGINLFEIIFFIMCGKAIWLFKNLFHRNVRDVIWWISGFEL